MAAKITAGTTATTATMATTAATAAITATATATTERLRWGYHCNDIRNSHNSRNNFGGDNGFHGHNGVNGQEDRDDSTSRLNSSIFPSPRYLSRDIQCTFSRCQCSSTSTPTTTESTAFAARISRFNNRGISNPVLTFSVRRTDIAPDGAYLTRENRVSNPSPAFCNASFNASIKSASDICWPDTSRGTRILLP